MISQHDRPNTELATIYMTAIIERGGLSCCPSRNGKNFVEGCVEG